NGREFVGVAEAKRFIQAFLTAFPDGRYSVEDTIVSGSEKIVTRWTATATHQGSFGGVAPTQKRVTMLGITIFALTETKITALWSTWDVQGVLLQLQ
ncbi:MAG: ester cyclase, partial [Microcoleus sp. CAN_BIN18]|nr:ester cyclase [Microcoleus sp. CAN_BIN18]